MFPSIPNIGTPYTNQYSKQNSKVKLPSQTRPKSAGHNPFQEPGTNFGTSAPASKQTQNLRHLTNLDDSILTPKRPETPKTNSHRRPHFVPPLDNLTTLPNETLPASIEITINNLFQLTTKAYDKEGYEGDKQEFERAYTAKYSSLDIQEWLRDALTLSDKKDFKTKVQELLLDARVERPVRREVSGRSYTVRSKVTNSCTNEFNGLVQTLLETAVFSKKGTRAYFEEQSFLPPTQEACEEHITKLYSHRENH